MAGKKIMTGSIIAAVLAGAVTLAAVATRSESFKEARAEVKELLNSTLTSQQLATLKAFRQAHKGERQQWLARRDHDPAKLWLDLNLTQDQQDQLLDIVDMNVDGLTPSLSAVRESASALRQAVLSGDPNNPAIQTAADGLGKSIGDAAVYLSGLQTQARGVLTPAQLAVLSDHEAQHDADLQDALQQMPAHVEDLVKLWNDLALTPDQVDGLSGIHDIMPRFMHKLHKDRSAAFRDDLSTILTSDQLGVIDSFRDEHAAQAKGFHQERKQMREMLRDELALTGDQKIKLVNLVISRRQNLELAADTLAQAALNLRDQVLAEKPDPTAIRAAAAKLGDVIASTASLAAQMVADAKPILTADQFAVIENAAAQHDQMAQDRLAQMPGMVHQTIQFLDKLALTPDQKSAIANLIEKKHEERKERFMKRGTTL